MALFRKCAEDLRGCGSATDGVEYASNAVIRTLEGVGELPLEELSEGVVSASDGVVRALE